jgi:hypothetical protein
VEAAVTRGLHARSRAATINIGGLSGGRLPYTRGHNVAHDDLVNVFGPDATARYGGFNGSGTELSGG